MRIPLRRKAAIASSRVSAIPPLGPSDHPQPICVQSHFSRRRRYDRRAMRGHEYLRHDDKAAAPAGAPETPPMPGGSGAKSPDVRAPERLYFTERGRVTLNHRKKMRYVPYSRRNSIPSVWLRDELRLGSRQVAARSNAPGNAKKAPPHWGGWGGGTAGQKSNGSS